MSKQSISSNKFKENKKTKNSLQSIMTCIVSRRQKQQKIWIITKYYLWKWDFFVDVRFIEN